MNHQSVPAAGYADLRELIANLLKAMLPQTVNNKSIFINEIPSKLTLSTDLPLVSAVLNGMLSSVVKHTRETYIWLSARVYGHVVLVHIRRQGNINTSIQQEVSKLHAMAEKILGSVSFNAERKDMATLTFGFPNLPPLD
ncbi:hypothetical protein [Terrimonas alba]|uniref:hypothetical protein n=1 Tax=Terrimonas alba TaxID=3349636 RepID=UPI0035F34B5B